jgi:hypothetical protein
LPCSPVSHCSGRSRPVKTPQGRPYDGLAGCGAYDRIGHAAARLPCGEQGKLRTAKAFKLAERDKTMSEQTKPKSFMQALDLWSEANIFRPLFGTDPNQDDWAAVTEQVKKAVRTKVLESYRNGQAAGPAKSRSFPPRRQQNR